jgi:hypothetical protein
MEAVKGAMEAYRCSANKQWRVSVCGALKAHLPLSIIKQHILPLLPRVGLTDEQLGIPDLESLALLNKRTSEEIGADIPSGKRVHQGA